MYTLVVAAVVCVLLGDPLVLALLAGLTSAVRDEVQGEETRGVRDDQHTEEDDKRLGCEDRRGVRRSWRGEENQELAPRFVVIGRARSMIEPTSVDPVIDRMIRISTAIVVLHDLCINRLFNVRSLPGLHALTDLLETEVHSFSGGNSLGVCNLNLNRTTNTRTVKNILCGLQADCVLGRVLEEVLDLVNGQVSKANEAETCTLDDGLGVLLHVWKCAAMTNTHRCTS